MKDDEKDTRTQNEQIHKLTSVWSVQFLRGLDKILDNETTLEQITTD